MAGVTTWEVEQGELLRECAAAYVEVALANIEREFPRHGAIFRTGPEPVPRPREAHPAFYGSLDWHSCVEMHWVLVRLLNVVPDALPRHRVLAALNEHLAADPLAAEAAHFAADPLRGPGPRPYSWAWTLMLAHEVAACPDADALRWSANLRELVELCVARYLHWLPRATYPVRHGVHTNAAFGLSRALPYATDRATAGDPALLIAITETACRWFGEDRAYPGEWEPSGIDFLSPALAEAELMTQLRPPGEFAGWLSGFLPGLTEGRPATLFTPVIVSDPTDGLIAHLHGLNLSRAWCWRRLAEALPAGDPRIEPMLDTAREHAHAALPHVTGSDYMVEHWLAAYAVLLLT